MRAWELAMKRDADEARDVLAALLLRFEHELDVRRQVFPGAALAPRMRAALGLPPREEGT
jgi:hypothetical protein